ncbi:ATP-grasp domain-containing protein [Novimethylophilus kurashikiensis]|nr:ATP-grasp domain-containing protein [Novimethylophilus kurashikiensis]
MVSNLKVFVCEFITGGGLYNAPLPDSLAREGQAMLEAMLHDIGAIPGVSLTTTRDIRLPVLEMAGIEVIQVAGDIDQCWTQCIDEADLVWAVAPESGGELQRLASMAQHKWLGCSPEAIRLATSKSATAHRLRAHGVPTVATFFPDDNGWIGASEKWVAKPDDGVGCGDMRIFDDAELLKEWLNDGRTDTHVIQPWLPGEATSLSMLCRDGIAQLLSCNRQLIETCQGEFHYRGSRLNDFSAHWDVFQALASQVAAAMPELYGYVGVDAMLHQGQLTVLEVNPRLTTSYAGLRQAIGLNPAELLLDLHYNGRFVETGLFQRNIVEVNVDD